MLGSCILYPDDLLKRRKNEGVFSSHDTHMTGIGNAIVTQEIIRRLGYEHDIFAAMHREIRPRHGDMAVMADLDPMRAEPTAVPGLRTQHLFDNRNALPSNTDNIAISHNKYATSDRRLLALGDSFLRDALPALSTFFRDVLYVRSDLFQPELLDLFAPDCVVSANAERYLSRVRRDRDADSIMLRGYGRENYSPAASFTEALKAELSRAGYRGVYDAWAAKLGALTFSGVGKGKANGQILIRGETDVRLEITGNDPQIVFADVGMSEGRPYRLHVTLSSSVDSMAQLFVGRNGKDGRIFTEDHSAWRKIHAGRNTLVFDIPPSGRGDQIRFDPTTAPGRVHIDAIDLIPVDG